MKYLAHFWCGVVAFAGGYWPPANASELVAEGTSFVVRQNGRTLRSPELVGTEIDIGDGMKLRIEAVRADPADTEILLHRFSIKKDAGAEWFNPCIADRNGLEEGFPLSGRWDAAMSFHHDKKHFVLTCTSGAEAKCIHRGYKPWKSSKNGESLQPLFESCVRMLRADYCGDGTATTRDGMAIAVYDKYAAQQPEIDAPGFEFEAGWTPAGAVCVNHMRVPDLVTLKSLARRCPRFRKAMGRACSEETARKAGAILFNLSYVPKQTEAAQPR